MDTTTVVVQLMGRTIGLIEAPKGLAKDELESFVCQSELFQTRIAGRDIKGIIFFKDRCINFVGQ